MLYDTNDQKYSEPAMTLWSSQYYHNIPAPQAFPPITVPSDAKREYLHCTFLHTASAF